ncbi:flagellar assembly protein FliW [Paenibacillus lignilyticus]|uniref:Flagellar assembly factor FliW n=1 Tax=Paenibacillus lignilyticus TaxID=1172615 RepID=A0ABS5CLP7_9BACL|nr:flagellar assembly protein FliW [Paenibacillus lignilyticus]MBP3966770.1 flagellar assembly protein FliW [Paenibacillus lignilyticus]
MLDFLQGKTFQLNGSILGFEECNEFSIKVVEENSHFAYLQSLEHDYISFLVISPFTADQDYSFEIEEKDKKLLEIEAPEDVCVLTIVTTTDPFTDSTINLIAPILLNMKNGQGKQTVLPPSSRYSTKEPLFKVVQLESGELSC